MTQDQYGQSGGSGYGVSDDAVAHDDADDSQGKPMTRFQKVASALLGDRPDRDETEPDGTATDQTVAAQSDMPTNPDVPPAGTPWGTHPGEATAATATPDSREALDAQDRDTPDAHYVAGDTVADGTVSDGTAADSTVADGAGAGIPAGVGVPAGSVTPTGSGTPADSSAQRDYWDEPAGSAAGAEPASLDREPQDGTAAQQDEFGDRPATPTFTPASEVAAEADDQPGTATIADVPAAGATAAEDDVPAGRHAAETAGSPAADAPVADAPVADAPMADAPVTDTSVADTTVTDVPVADAPVAGTPAGTAAADTAVTDTAVTDTAAGTAASDTAAADTAAAGPAAGDLRPGEAAGKLGDFSDLTFGSLIPDAAAYTDQWQQVQFRFVDDPRGSVTEAAEIVKQVTAKLESAIQERLQAIQQRQHAIQDQQKSLDSRWGEGSNADTETLRETLRMYKTFLDQLVGPKA